ncbi:cyclohexanone monooxygenase [Colletotrichum truncatum]|uniref:Cyclohexanone monooxygenase n=1 Tax=Colletotrichum truncatum TaxID=5467 RepID=A0ACC3ZC64_COLTU|nr:cyclohexanone monooxygenase [Colletotrichum truncatum]KAF6783843.1 cyclohexanone monooxygenase [Colletotrichum truncatum]
MASMLFSGSGATGLEPAAKDTITIAHPLKTMKINTAAIKAKYEEERAKRNIIGVSQFKHAQGSNARFKSDVLKPTARRDPVTLKTSTLICGAGFAGLVTSVNLKQTHGIDDFVIIDKAGGFGGTWYWNQYPGVACDVESYLYMPFLEETGYTPKQRFSYGPEIREQVGRIVKKWDLEPHAYFHTEITAMDWDASIKRWHVYTNQQDHFIAQFVVLATGTFHEMKLPGLPGLETFQNPHFHSSRWDYNITGGSPTDWNLDKLADKTVGIIGTGASAVQLVPQLAKNAKKLYVFQRTPSSITWRENTATSDDPEISALVQQKGWQRARMDEFANILQGAITDHDCSALEGLEALTVRALVREAQEAGATMRPEEIPELLQMADFRLMETIRKKIENTVQDRATAESLKPWYPFMCKRPTFNNDYLAAFNNPNVELVDTGGQGVERLTSTAVVANGREYPVDILVYSTGFDYETDADFYHRTGIRLVGRSGRTIDEAAADRRGPATLFGIHFREFPNLFNIGPAQSGVTANWTHTTYVAGEHIAAVIADLRRGKKLGESDCVEAIEPTEEAVESWGKQVDEGHEMRLQFNSSCPPGYYNKQGQPEDISSRMAYYPKGIIEWQKVMREWREEGDLKGMSKT